MISIQKYVFKYVFLLPPLLILHFFLLFNLQFTAWPEMLSYAYLYNSGFLLYKDIIQPYPPGLILILSAIYKIFGYNLLTLQIFTWVLILLSSVFVFVISLMLTKRINIALLTLGLYVLLQPFLDGNMLWFDIAVVLPILIATFFYLNWLLSARPNGRVLILSGLFFAVAVLIKQSSAIFVVAALFILLLKRRITLKNVIYFLGCPFVLAGLFLVWLFQDGQLADFWNWTFFYPIFFWKGFPRYIQLSPSFSEASLLATLVLPVTIFLFLQRRLIHDTKIQALIVFLLAAIIAIYPRFSFFHFQTALAFFVIILGILLADFRTKYVLLVIGIMFASFYHFVFRPGLFHWGQDARFYSKEDIQLVESIKSRVKADERLFVFGLSSSIYPLSDRVPPKPWADNFGWYLEIPGVQREIIARWEENPPDVVVWRTPNPGNWFDLGTYQPKKIATWVEANYTKEKEIAPGIWLWKLVLSD